MASIRALRGKIHPGLQLCGGVDDASGSVATQPPRLPCLDSGVYAPITGQTRLAIAATECRPIIHHGQHQSLTRQNSPRLLHSCAGEWMLLGSYPAPKDLSS